MIVARHSSMISRCVAPQGSSRPSPLASPGKRTCSDCARHCLYMKGQGGCKMGTAVTAPIDKPSTRKHLAAPPEAVGLYYSTATGKTQEVAEIIKDEYKNHNYLTHAWTLVLGDAVNDPVDIGDMEDLAQLADASFDGIIVGAPTWNTGADEGRSGTAWDEVLEKVQGLRLRGRKVAVFGCGDQHGYSDYFCDAMEELYSTFAAAGADMVGLWPTEGYEHSASKAEIEPGMFCGLALDQDNQDDLTEGRIRKWTAQVMQQMGVAAITTACDTAA